MKLANDALLEIVAIIQDGLANGRDVSQALRDLDLYDTSSGDRDGPLGLSEEYLAAHPRGGPSLEN
jgi:hypothetical protein